MSNILKTKCDACGTVRSERSDWTGSRLRHWFRVDGSLIDFEDEESGIVVLEASDGILDFCGTECLSTFLWEKRSKRKEEAEAKTKPEEKYLAEADAS